MSLLRSSDWLDLRSEMDRLVDDFLTNRFTTSETTKQVWAPAVDISEKPEELVVRADLPGVKHDDLEIEVANNVLTLKGERRGERKDDKENYHFVERSYGSFFRSFTLPTNVDPNGIHATLNDGQLTISIPKAAEAKARKVKISKEPKQVEAKAVEPKGKTLAAGSSS